MKGFSVRLRKYRLQASNTEKGVIEMLLRKPEEILGLSIHDMAKKTYSSASTITRMCRNMGFENYKEFQNAMLYESVYINETDLRVGLETIEKTDSLKQIANKVTSNNMRSLEDTRRLIDYKVLEKVVDLIQKSTHLAFFGIGASLLVAKDAYLKFLRVNKSSSVNDDWHAQLVQASNMSEDDVAIVFSYSGQTTEMIKCAKEAKEKGAKVIAITGFIDSPLTRVADYNIYVASIEHLVRSGAMTSRIAQLNMIDIIFTKYVNDNHDLYLNKIKKTHIEKLEDKQTS